jgi:hypothetical protein
MIITTLRRMDAVIKKGYSPTNTVLSFAVPSHLREFFPREAIDVEACEHDDYLLAASATFYLTGLIIVLARGVDQPRITHFFVM